MDNEDYAVLAYRELSEEFFIRRRLLPRNAALLPRSERANFTKALQVRIKALEMCFGPLDIYEVRAPKF